MNISDVIFLSEELENANVKHPTMTTFDQVRTPTEVLNLNDCQIYV